MRRRKAETLVEFLMSMTIFGVVMTGIFDFMNNQMKTLADFKDRDAIMFYTQRRLNGSTDSYSNVDMVSKDNTLTVSKGGVTMTFNLKP